VRFPSTGSALALTVTLVLAAVDCDTANGIQLTATSGPVFDDFLGPAGSAPAGQYWTADLGQSAAAGGLENNTNAAENIRLDGQGHLVIEAVATPTGFTSGRISTVGKVDMLYGSVAARIKLPTGFAIWPAFWLLGSNFSAVSWPQCGEIDIVDMVTDASNFYVG
jgi:beta-glucanase (GH16 family)